MEEENKEIAREESMGADNNHPLRGEVPFEGDGKEDKETSAKVDGRHVKGPNDEYHHKYDSLEPRKDEICQMIRNGVTKRVIHKQMGVSRSVLERFIRDNPELVEAWKDAQEDLLDLNEEVISELATLDCSMIENENGTFCRYDGRSLATKFNAAKLRLERLGSKRGWNAKLETNEVGNGFRQPIICVGEFSDEELANNKAMLDEANKAALEGLEGVPHG